MVLSQCYYIPMDEILHRCTSNKVFGISIGRNPEEHTTIVFELHEFTYSPYGAPTVPHLRAWTHHTRCQDPSESKPSHLKPQFVKQGQGDTKRRINHGQPASPSEPELPAPVLPLILRRAQELAPITEEWLTKYTTLVAEWIHFTLLGIRSPTIKPKMYTFGASELSN